MKELFLVTTALEDTWPESNKPVLYLGKWCQLYSRKHYWMKFDSEIAPYHWDDRDKLYEDCKYLQNLFERMLTELTVELNKIHEVNYDSRYWRIIVGPWLMMFLPIIFDRWSCLHNAIDKYPVTNTKIHEGINLNWSLPSGTRSEALDEESLKLLNQTGCNYLVYAPESASLRTLKTIKKKIIFNIIYG